MKTTILLTTILLFSITTDTVKADTTPIPKEQKSNIVEDIFKFTDDILTFSGNILNLGKENNCENTPVKEQVVQDKQENDIVKNLYSFGEDIVKFSWNIITLGYDEKEEDHYQERPTHEQLENAEAMSIVMWVGECFANSVVGD